MGKNDPLTQTEIQDIAKEVVKQQDEAYESKFWIHDKRKRYRVIFVAVAMAVFFALETYAHMQWSHRIFEICTDCIADFLLFGSVE